MSKAAKATTGGGEGTAGVVAVVNGSGGGNGEKAGTAVVEKPMALTRPVSIAALGEGYSSTSRRTCPRQFYSECKSNRTHVERREKQRTNLIAPEHFLLQMVEELERNGDDVTNRSIEEN